MPAKGEHQASHRVIADHLRATSFLIADGVLPSNEGRGYVLRRIMRRAMRHAHLLGAKEPLMYRLVPALVQQMGETYHELVRAQPLITETLKLEETRFRKTLEKGLGLLGEASGNLKKGDVFAGDTAFKLYDTFGFPLDLTQDALKPRGISVDTGGLRRGDGEAEGGGAQGLEGLRRGGHRDRLVRGQGARRRHRLPGLRHGEPPRARSAPSSRTARRSSGLKAGEEAALVLNQTPFYGESGGQVGDQGVIKGAKGALFRVTDTQKKLGDLFVHIGRVEKGAFKPGDAVELVVDHARRSATRANHSATHLLHEALRQVLGDRTWRRRARWSRPTGCASTSRITKPMSAEEIAAVEAMANAYRAAELARRDAADGARGRDGDGRHGAVRREVRR